MDVLTTHINKNILKKYAVPAFDYIEYPHKSFWKKDIGDNEYRNALKEVFGPEKNFPTTLYVHIPFCHQLCYYCVCHREITRDYQKIKNYLYNSLFREIQLFNIFFKENSISPNIQEIYIGGGTPNLVEESDFVMLLENIFNLADKEKIKKFTVEIDPRTVTKEKLLFYHTMGVNTLSFGVQEFNDEVQKIINRVQPFELVKNLLSNEVREKFKSINFDILCGLPKQTPESIKQTMKKVIYLSPDRISFTYYHHGSLYHSHQKLLSKEGPLPDFFERQKIFQQGVEMILKNGYVRTGFEHFAKPSDDVAKAVKDKTLGYNSLGAVCGICQNMLGVGRQSYSGLGQYYFQNVYEQEEYDACLSQKRFPIFRGYKLSNDDIIRRETIHTLRSYLSCNFATIEKKYNIDFKKYFNKEIASLAEFVKDSIVVLTDKTITITELGQQFVNVVCMYFDNYVKKF